MRTLEEMPVMVERQTTVEASSSQVPDNSNEETNSQEQSEEDVEMTKAERDESETAKQTEQDEDESSRETSAPTEALQPAAPEASTANGAGKIVISAEKMQQLTLMKKFHTDAIKFIQQIHSAVPIICQLLSSKSKQEVLEAMDFLVTAYEYKVKSASVSGRTHKLCKFTSVQYSITRKVSEKCYISFGQKIQVTKERASR